MLVRCIRSESDSNMTRERERETVDQLLVLTVHRRGGSSSPENGLSLFLCHLPPDPPDAEANLSLLSLFLLFCLQICPANLQQ